MMLLLLTTAPRVLTKGHLEGAYERASGLLVSKYKVSISSHFLNKVNLSNRKEKENLSW